MDQATLDRHLGDLHEQGYTIARIEPELNRHLADTISRIERDLEVTPRNNRAEGFNTKRFYNLLAKDRAFWDMPTHPAVLPVVEALLDRWCILSGTTSMNIGPGEELQGLHSDDGNVTVPRPHLAMMATTIWAIDDFTADNGATWIVPGSHRAEREPTADDNGDAIPAEMEAGSVLIMNSSLWHCGGPNTTRSAWRRGANVQYCLGWMRGQQNHYLSLPAHEVRAMPKRLQQLCGYALHKGALGHIDGMSPGAVVGAAETTKRAYEYAERSGSMTAG